MKNATVVFHPQAWLNDWGIEVDPEGPTTFEAAVPDEMRDDSNESDALLAHPNAPEWIKKWSGPFWFEIIRHEDETTT